MDKLIKFNLQVHQQNEKELNILITTISKSEN